MRPPPPRARPSTTSTCGRAIPPPPARGRSAPTRTSKRRNSIMPGSRRSASRGGCRRPASTSTYVRKKRCRPSRKAGVAARRWPRETIRRYRRGRRGRASGRRVRKEKAGSRRSDFGRSTGSICSMMRSCRSGSRRRSYRAWWKRWTRTTRHS